MPKRAIPVCRKTLSEVVATVKSSKYPTQDAYLKAVAKKYNCTKSPHYLEITHSVVYLRIREWNLPYRNPYDSSSTANSTPQQEKQQVVQEDIFLSHCTTHSITTPSRIISNPTKVYRETENSVNHHQNDDDTRLARLEQTVASLVGVIDSLRREIREMRAESSKVKSVDSSPLPASRKATSSVPSAPFVRGFRENHLLDDVFNN